MRRPVNTKIIFVQFLLSVWLKTKTNKYYNILRFLTFWPVSSSVPGSLIQPSVIAPIAPNWRINSNKQIIREWFDIWKQNRKRESEYKKTWFTYKFDIDFLNWICNRGMQTLDLSKNWTKTNQNTDIDIELFTLVFSSFIYIFIG